MYGWTSFSEVLSNSAISRVGSDIGGNGNGFKAAKDVDNVSVKKKWKLDFIIQVYT